MIPDLRSCTFVVVFLTFLYVSKYISKLLFQSKGYKQLWFMLCFVILFCAGDDDM